MNELSQSTERIASHSPKQFKTVVIIGRFRPVHDGHMELISQALKLGEQVIVAIGSAHRPRTIKNPITSIEAEVLISRALKEEYCEIQGWTDFPQEIEKRVKFIHARDHMYNNTRWSQELYSKATRAGASQDKSTALLGCFKDDSSWYLNMFPQWELKTIKPVKSKEGKIINATDFRNEMFEEKYVGGDLCEIVPNVVWEDMVQWINSPIGDQLRDEYHFIKSYKEKWEAAPFPPTFMTTDAIVIKSGHVLLVKRKFNPGKGLWALPGGFVNQNEHIKDCVIRELKEETKIKVDKPVLRRSIKEMKVFDHPKRSLRGRTITFAYLIDLGEGPLPVVKGSDDAEFAGWIPLADLGGLEDQMFEDHNDIIQNLVSKY